nr:CHAP domain-containing protein [uncultured Kingella sp.]
MGNSTSRNINARSDAEYRQEIKEQLIQKILANAEKEVGYQETGRNINKYADIAKVRQGESWCNTFYNALYIQSFNRPLAQKMLGVLSPATEDSKKAFEGMGTWHSAGSGYIPQPGDAIFYNFKHKNHPKRTVDHIGIVKRVENGIIYTIEGNTGNSRVAGNPAKERDGDGVYHKERRLTFKDIVRFGTPNWKVAVDYMIEHEQHQKPENKLNNVQVTGNRENNRSQGRDGFSMLILELKIILQRLMLPVTPTFANWKMLL